MAKLVIYSCSDEILITAKKNEQDFLVEYGFDDGLSDRRTCDYVRTVWKMESIADTLRIRPGDIKVSLE